MFPALAEFLRGRQQLKTLHLSVCDESVQRAVGFDASVWGVLPSLVNLKGLTITYPSDLTPGLAPWLIPRSVHALALEMDHIPTASRDPVGFLDVCVSPFSCLKVDLSHSSSNIAIEGWHATDAEVHRTS